MQPYNRKYRSIGHRVWSMSLNFLTEMSVNPFNENEKHTSAEPFNSTCTVSDRDAVLGASSPEPTPVELPYS